MHLLDRCWRRAPWFVLVAWCAACNPSTRTGLSDTGLSDTGLSDTGLSDRSASQGLADLKVSSADPAESAPARGSSLTPDAGLSDSSVRITEIHYHPSASAPGSEFIEIVNAGPESVSLGGWTLTRGVSFTFPTEASLEPGAFTVVAQSLETLRRHFGSDVDVAGEYTGRLDNAGELIRLEDSTGRTVSDVRYSDLAPWPEAADGLGLSLQRVSQERDVDDPENWGAGSPTPGGPHAAPWRGANLSIFDVGRVPNRPEPGSSVKITATSFHVSRAVDLSLHYDSGGGRERSVPMRRDSTRKLGEGHESTFSANVPPYPASSVIRYWITARSAGDSERSPTDSAPLSNYAYFVEDSATDTTVPVYRLLIEPRSLSQLQRNPWRNQLYPATFAHDGRVYENVQVRLRGAWARSWPKKNWKIFFPKGARFSKRSRINLNSCWRDAAFIRESMAYEIYKRCDALSLRTKMVRLHINGQFWGLFVDVEQPKKRYLSRNGIPGAVLYKAVSRRSQSDERFFRSAAEYGRHYENETHPEDSFEALQDFCRSLATSQNVAEFFETRLDLPRYINYLCASTLTQNWDAFNKNHFIAHDREGSGKWYVIPWDVDRTLGDHWNGSFSTTDLPLLLGTRYNQGATGWNRLVDRFFSDPALKKRYMDRLAELLQTTFTEEKLLPHVDRLAGPIATEAALDRSRWGGQGDWRSAVELVRSFITKRRQFLLSELPGNAPARPRNLAPAAGGRVTRLPLILKASTFRRGPRGGAHGSTHWQVREASSSYATPALSVVTRDGQDSVSIARGILRPETPYFWRVAHVDKSGKASEYSAETPFVTGDFAFTAVSLDLTSHVNADLVAGPGDSTNDTLDGSRLLIVDGYDGRRADNPAAGGLPKSGIVGVHQLGDYRVNNAVQMTRASSRAIDFPVEPGRYSFVRFVVTGGNGDSRIPVRLVYTDGPHQRETLTCNDWYRSDSPDRPPRNLGPRTVTILHGMDRIRRGSFKDNNRPALFEVTLRLDPGRTLTAIHLDAQGAVYDSRSTTFNLFAATAIRAE